MDAVSLNLLNLDDRAGPDGSDGGASGPDGSDGGASGPDGSNGGASELGGFLLNKGFLSTASLSSYTIEFGGGGGGGGGRLHCGGGLGLNFFQLL